ncbi:MAG: ORF6N domain-containing protein [Steroidobacteraceae bacterium]
MGIARRILVLRGQRVLLVGDLAALYGVSSKRLNEQVRRKRARFPEDFAFQLELNELRTLRSQIATLERGRGRHSKYSPTAFTEHGAIMAATVLNSPRAVEMSSTSSEPRNWARLIMRRAGSSHIGNFILHLPCKRST